ncbi:MAG: class I SAM-dependent methyltransferase, partial [Terriglobales bacterium]
TWGDPAVVAARRRWTPASEATTREATEALLAAAELRPGLHVLDLASGTGNPALSIAAAIAPDGRVFATDIVPGLLAYADERARGSGLANFSTRQASADSLPFPDASFDLLTCRFGVMFFPDVPRALQKARRALKIGGRVVFAAWGSTAQPFFQLTFGILLRHVDASYAAEAHSPFKFGQPGTLFEALRSAGFAAVHEESREIALRFPGTVEEFWHYMLESAALAHQLFESIAPGKRERFIAEAHAALRPYADGPSVNIPAAIVLASATR